MITITITIKEDANGTAVEFKTTPDDPTEQEAVYNEIIHESFDVAMNAVVQFRSAMGGKCGVYRKEGEMKVRPSKGL